MADPAPRELFRFTQRRTVAVEGRVLTGFSPKMPGDRFWIRLKRFEGKKQKSVKVLAYLSRSDPDTARLRPGMMVRLEGRLRFPMKPRWPGGFDERAFLWLNRAHFVLHAKEVRIDETRVPWRWQLRAWGESIHRSVHDYLKRRFEKTRASILEGLLLGYKGALPRGLPKQIQDAGVMHMLTPSGAKVTVLLIWAFLLSAVLGLGPRARMAACALAGFLYLLVVGFAPPYTRAYGMALVLFFGLWADRESGGFQGLVVSALVSLIYDPRILFSAGFQLSYLAMLGLLIGLPRWKPPRQWPSLLRRGLQVLAISFIVQLMLWPTFAGFFGRGSILGLLVNLLVVPASAPVMTLTALAWAAAVTGLGWFERLFAWGAGLGAEGFLRVCRFAASVPGCAVDLAPMSGFGVAGYYAGALGLLVLPNKRAAAVLGSAALALWLPAAAYARLSTEFRAVFFSSRRGSAAILSLPDGRKVLIGRGISKTALRDARRRLGIRRFAEVRHPPFEYRFKDLRIRWEGWGAAVSTEGGVDFCIMAVPSLTSRRRCPYDRSYPTRWRGAVWVRSDGSTLEIETTEDRDSLGRDFP